MSLESVKTIIGRAVMEPEFRALLLDEPDKALAEYDLSAEETASLKALKRESFDEIASELGERVSRAGIGSLFDGIGDFAKMDGVEGIGDFAKWDGVDGELVSRVLKGNFNLPKLGF